MVADGVVQPQVALVRRPGAGRTQFFSLAQKGWVPACAGTTES